MGDCQREGGGKYGRGSSVARATPLALSQQLSLATMAEQQHTHSQCAPWPGSAWAKPGYNAAAARLRAAAPPRPGPPAKQHRSRAHAGEAAAYPLIERARPGLAAARPRRLRSIAASDGDLPALGHTHWVARRRPSANHSIPSGRWRSNGLPDWKQSSDSLPSAIAKP